MLNTTLETRTENAMIIIANAVKAEYKKQIDYVAVPSIRPEIIEFFYEGEIVAQVKILTDSFSWEKPYENLYRQEKIRTMQLRNLFHNASLFY